MAVTIVHLSHTDVRVDARILKEVAALQGLGPVCQVVVGIDRPEGAVVGESDLHAELIALRLRARTLRRFSWIPGLLRNALGLVEATIRMMALILRHRPRVVHCHDVGFLHVGALASLLLGSKVVYDAHELESARNGDSRALSRCVYCAERALWRFVDHLVSVSPSIIDWYAREMGAKPSTLVLNSPVCQATLQRRPDDLARRKYFHDLYSLDTDDLVFVYLGVFCKGRGIELFANAVRASGARIHFVMVGFGELLDVHALSRDCSRIHVHPAVPHERVVELVRSADFGVCLVEDVSLSDRLCLPNKLFEYAFAGLPVLASDLPEIRRVVDRHGLGVCCAPDPGSVSRAVERLQSSSWSIDVAALGELGWQTQADRLREAYRSLLGP